MMRLVAVAGNSCLTIRSIIVLLTICITKTASKPCPLACGVAYLYYSLCTGIPPDVTVSYARVLAALRGRGSLLSCFWRASRPCL